MVNPGNINPDNKDGRLPKSIRDGSVAAAIGVALALAVESGSVEMQRPERLAEAPWTGCSRSRMNFSGTGFQTRDGWGKLAGWKPAYGKWRLNRWP
jgi:hypothetical protein